jgi:hypothetical protein
MAKKAITFPYIPIPFGEHSLIGKRFIDHLCKTDPLEECCNKSKTSISGHLSPGKRYFDFVYLDGRGRICLHRFIPPFAWVDCLVDY